MIFSRLILALLLLCALLVNLTTPEKIEGFLFSIPYRCPLKWITGWKCAFCGMTHSWIAIFRGEWSTAYQENILGIPFLLLTVFVLGVYSFQRRITINLKAFLASSVAFMIVYALLRNID